MRSEGGRQRWREAEWGERSGQRGTGQGERAYAAGSPDKCVRHGSTAPAAGSTVLHVTRCIVSVHAGCGDGPSSCHVTTTCLRSRLPRHTHLSMLSAALSDSCHVTCNTAYYLPQKGPSCGISHCLSTTRIWRRRGEDKEKGRNEHRVVDEHSGERREGQMQAMTRWVNQLVKGASNALNDLKACCMRSM